MRLLIRVYTVFHLSSNILNTSADSRRDLFQILDVWIRYTVCCLLFQIAAEVSAPLSKTDEIVLVGDDRTTSEVSRLISNLPPAVQALTGVDLSKVIFGIEKKNRYFMQIVSDGDIAWNLRSCFLGKIRKLSITPAKQKMVHYTFEPSHANRMS